MPASLNEIVQNIRSRITSGAIAPGERLPTNSELVDHFTSSSLTVQRAYTQLQQEGFVKAEGRHGTFVAPHPPHLTRFILIFPESPLALLQGPTLYEAGLLQAAEALQSETVRISCIHGIGGWSHVQRQEVLLQKIQEERIAGIIYANHPHVINRSKLLTQRKVPQVSVQSQSQHPHIPAIWTDSRGFLKQAISALNGVGCKRPALIMPPYGNQTYSLAILADFKREVKACGMEYHDDLILALPLNAPLWVERALNQILTDSKRRQPDGVIVLDDHLLEPVSKTLKACGWKPKGEAAVVSFCNAPVFPHSHVPARMIGNDATVLLQTCITCLQKQRRGEGWPQETLISVAEFPRPDSQVFQGSPDMLNFL